MPKIKSFLDEPLSWSAAMQRVFKQEVDQSVRDHEESTVPNRIYFGYEGDYVREHVIEKGVADFSNNHKDLTPAQRVLCYCYFNMQRHFFAAYAHFRLYQNRLRKLIDSGKDISFIDIGCGPGTAALAFAELFRDVRFAYYGVDQALPMLTQCRKMIRAAKTHGLITQDTTANYMTDWAELDTSISADSAVIVNFSYFFGSPFLDEVQIASLVTLYGDLNANAGDSPVQISFTNSTHPVANEWYKKFIEGLGLTYSEREPVSRQVRFTRNGFEVRPAESFHHELFTIVEVDE